jgi:hypothetical protein
VLSGVRGVQAEDLQRGERPPDLWEVLPPLGNESLPADASRDELAMQLKVREALIKDAVKEVEVFADDPEDWIQWRDATIAVFEAAGRKEVLMPRFREWAAAENWTVSKINEVDRWARAVIGAGIVGCDAALDAFELAPAGQGSVAFAHMRRQFEIMGSFVKK